MLPSAKQILRTRLKRDTTQSSANTIAILQTSFAEIVRLLFVTVKYSATVTQDVTITLNSGQGVPWDTLLGKMQLSAQQDGVFIPDGVLDIEADDEIAVLAPAGGAGITSAIAIYTEVPW